MRRAVPLLLALAMIVAAGTASAGPKKKARPVKTTLYLHGEAQADETTLAPLHMTPAEPSQPLPYSKWLPNYVAGPKDDCVNDWFLNATFQGPMSGRITGDVKVTLYSASTPGTVEVRLIPDFTDFLCGDPKHQPVATTRIDLTPGAGPSEGVIKNVSIDVQGVLVMTVLPIPSPPFAGRLLYDSPDFASRIQFDCIPTRGTSCAN